MEISELGVHTRTWFEVVEKNAYRWTVRFLDHPRYGVTVVRYNTVTPYRVHRVRFHSARRTAYTLHGFPVSKLNADDVMAFVAHWRKELTDGRVAVPGQVDGPV
jgi:hypothetical protein